MSYIKLFIIAFLVFFIVDLIWLGLIAKNFYQTEIGHLLAPSPNWTAAIIFYVLYIIFLIIFAIGPATASSSLGHAMLYGALFGFITYATYDLTNLATLKDWPLLVTVVDVMWGTTLGFTVSTLTYLIYKWVF